MAREEIIVACRRTFSAAADIRADFTISGENGRGTALFGPSGCGKSTCLRLLAGLEAPDAGSIRHGETVWNDESQKIHVPVQQRAIGYLFQDHALFPHLSVAQNTGYGLRQIPASERNRRVNEVLDLVGLAGRAASRPHQLSGGQCQRVALARALVRRPRWILLDEPLSSLDEALRADVRRELKATLRAWQVPSILVTHDRRELEEMADDMILMDGGEILQSGPVAEVMASPVSLAAARVLGFDNIHLLAALPPGSWMEPAPGKTHLVFRAEDAWVVAAGSPVGSADFAFPGIVQSALGEGPLIRIRVDGGILLEAVISRQHVDSGVRAPGRTVEFRVPAARCRFLA